ncbi:MAG: hypothetical protein ABI782_08350 [Anaerolineaceae bacterium]
MNSARLVALSITSILVVGCASHGNADDHVTGLENQVCLQPDVPADFRRQTSGDFTAQNLADLGPNPEQRLKQLAAAGMRDGHFAYWKQTVGSPPFEPPLDVICQALAFDSESHAAAFVQAIRPRPDDLATTALTWLPDGSRTVTEEPTTLSPTARAFAIRAEDSQTSVEISAVVFPDGRFVRTVYIGGNGRPASVVDAVEIQLHISERLQ